MLVVKTESAEPSPLTSNTPAARDRLPAASREKSKRPQLSCNACRTRKVKCDRIQPCTACSLHQQADLCHYELTEAERHPILQAEALKVKDKEIARLREDVRLLEEQSSKSARRLDCGQRRPPKRNVDCFSKELETLVVGEDAWPLEVGIASSLSSGRSVALAVCTDSRTSASCPADSSVRMVNHFKVQMTTTYPFPTLWSALQGTSALAHLLPDRVALFSLLDAFHRQAQPVFFPYIPENCTRREVELFLAKFEHNAAVHPDKLALLFATLAQGVLCMAYDRCGKERRMGFRETETQKGDLFVAAAMQALRTASFMSRPTLHVIETLLMIGPYLVATGKSLDASSLLAITVRLAQGIGLHHDPNHLHPSPSPRETDVRKRIWWWILQVDQEFSMTLGQPLAVSSTGDCPSPASSGDTPRWPYLDAFTNQFTTVSRQILSGGTLPYTKIVSLADELLHIQTTLPKSIRFREQWLDDTTPLSEWPQRVASALFHSRLHYLLLLLNRHRTDVGNAGNSATPSATATADFNQCGPEKTRDFCRSILQAYDFLTTRTYATFFCWMASLQALTAAWTLLFSGLDTYRDHKDIDVIQRTYDTLARTPHLGLDSMIGEAVEKLEVALRCLSERDTLETPKARHHKDPLVRDPDLQAMLRFSLLPPAYEVSRIGSLGDGSAPDETYARATQQDPSLLTKKPKKPRKTGSTPGANIKVSDKKSAAKQRRHSTIQSRFSGVPVQGKGQQGTSVTEMAVSPAQLLDVPNSKTQADDLGTSLPWSPVAIQNDPTNNSMASLLTTSVETGTALDFSAFLGNPNPTIDARVTRMMTPFKPYTAAKHNAELQKRATEMFRSSSETFSDHTTSQFGFPQSFTQFPSPPQSQDSADSPDSRQLCIPGGSQISAQLTLGPLPQLSAQNSYEHTFHGLLFGQADGLLPPGSQPATELSEYPQQMSHSGYDNRF